MKRALLKATAATAIAMVGMGGHVGVASAGGQGGTPVAGLLEPDVDHSCTANPDAAAAYDVSGSLNGCWYVDEFIYKNESNAGGFVATGTETFDGCLDTRCGHFFTTYTFTARYIGDVEQHGRCVHPITGGDGGFDGVSGVITMKDLPNGCATYRGQLRL